MPTSDTDGPHVVVLNERRAESLRHNVFVGIASLERVVRARGDAPGALWVDAAGFVAALGHHRADAGTRFACLVDVGPRQVRSRVVALTPDARIPSDGSLPPLPATFEVGRWLAGLADHGEPPAWIDPDVMSFLEPDGTADGWFERVMAEAHATSPLDAGHDAGFNRYALLHGPPVAASPPPPEWVPTGGLPAGAGAGEGEGHWRVPERDGWSLAIGATWPTEWRPTVHRGLTVDAAEVLLGDAMPSRIRGDAPEPLTAIVFHTRNDYIARSCARHVHVYAGRRCLARFVVPVLDGGLGYFV